MLKAVFSSMVLLCCYFIAMIVFNHLGISEHFNLFICSLCLSLAFIYCVKVPGFYAASCLGLMFITLALGQYMLFVWLSAGLGLGYLMAHLLPYLSMHLSATLLHHAQYTQIKPQHQPNSDRA